MCQEIEVFSFDIIRRKSTVIDQPFDHQVIDLRLNGFYAYVLRAQF